MGSKIRIAAGIVVILPAVLLFALDFSSLRSMLLEILALIAFLTSILTGKKMAMYLHDLHLASSKNYSLGPAMFIYAWLIAFVIFLLIYTIMKLALGYFVKIVMLPFGGSYVGLIYNTLLLFGVYLLFNGVYFSKSNFLTLWGKAAERGAKMPRRMAGNIGETMRRFMR